MGEGMSVSVVSLPKQRKKSEPKSVFGHDIAKLRCFGEFKVCSVTKAESLILGMRQDVVDFLHHTAHL